jgi:hypothetical protein
MAHVIAVIQQRRATQPNALYLFVYLETAYILNLSSSALSSGWSRRVAASPFFVLSITHPGVKSIGQMDGFSGFKAL